jgi:hypothetical protein
MEFSTMVPNKLNHKKTEAGWMESYTEISKILPKRSRTKR